MAEMQRTAFAEWHGDSRSGNGRITTPSGVLKDDAYTYLTRFGTDQGTNPEELIAAAHAACFSMAFASALSRKGFIPDTLETKAILTMEREEIGWTVTKIRLEVNAKVPNIDESLLTQTSAEAEKNCPISRLLRPGLREVEVSANLV